MIRIATPADAGTALAEARRSSNWLRHDVAQAVGMYAQQYSQYEKGQVVPTIAVLIRLAHALGYDLALIPREDAV